MVEALLVKFLEERQVIHTQRVVVQPVIGYVAPSNVVDDLRVLPSRRLSLACDLTPLPDRIFQL